MATAVARALAVIAVFFQSYFNWKTEVDQSGGIDTRNGHHHHHLAGLILARGGSKGIPKKNLAEVNGTPLIGRALDAMIESGVFTTIWVSTDDNEIETWIKNQYSSGAVGIHRRAAYTATDSATSISAALEFLSFHPEIDSIGLVQATSPFIQALYLKQAALMLLNRNYDSVFSTTKSHQLRWSIMDEGKWTKPLNFNPSSRPRRQDWKGEMVENGMFYFALRHVLINYQIFQAEKSGYVEIPKHLSMEIDTSHDLDIARCLALKLEGGTDSSRFLKSAGERQEL